MFKPNFEDPIGSAKQLVENNITLFEFPGGEFWVRFLANSPIPEYQTLSKRLIIPNDNAHRWDLIENGTIGNGTHATMTNGLSNWDKSLGRWWKGNLVEGHYPYSGLISDKKWHLIEAFDIFSYFFCY